ncbi:Uncharacterised protein [uncultured archaeon]|nr:Uncharacterised protein [uncultured archaeon]
MSSNRLEKLLFRFNQTNARGMRRLRRMLRSSGFQNRALGEATLEIQKRGYSPMDAALQVASLASFAFEMDVCYMPLKNCTLLPEFVIELY